MNTTPKPLGNVLFNAGCAVAVTPVPEQEDASDDRISVELMSSPPSWDDRLDWTIQTHGELCDRGFFRKAAGTGPDT
jgi:hypothetical protein